jgi:hypothetical protein
VAAAGLAAFRIKVKPELFNGDRHVLATERVMAKQTCHWRVSVVVAALVVTGCNGSQDVNLSSRAAPGVVAGPGYNPYDPISYAQNNTGNRSAR